MGQTSKASVGEYGRSEHYLGSAGEHYFAAQKQGGLVSVQWNISFWLPHLKPDDRIMDFGCGGGYLLANLPIAEKVGVEINPAARKEVERQGIAVYPTLGDLPEGLAFSTILSSHALEHVPSPVEALKSMRTLLEPDGQLLLLLPLDDWRAPHHRQYRKGDVHFHLYNWTPQNLGNILVEAGFNPEDIRIITDAMPPLPITQKVLPYRWLRQLFGWTTGVLLNRRQIWAKAKLAQS